MHGPDHAPPIECKRPFLKTMDVTASSNEYGFEFRRKPERLPREPCDLRVTQYQFLEGFGESPPGKLLAIAWREQRRINGNIKDLRVVVCSRRTMQFNCFEGLPL